MDESEMDESEIDVYCKISDMISIHLAIFAFAKTHNRCEIEMLLDVIETRANHHFDGNEGLVKKNVSSTRLFLMDCLDILENKQ